MTDGTHYNLLPKEQLMVVVWETPPLILKPPDVCSIAQFDNFEKFRQAITSCRNRIHFTHYKSGENLKIKIDMMCYTRSVGRGEAIAFFIVSSNPEGTGAHAKC